MNTDYINTYEKFKEITGYDIQVFFTRFTAFVSSYYPYIIDYYNSGEINRDAFYELDSLFKESDKIEPLFVLHRNTLDNIGMWFLLDTFSEIKTKLLTIRMSAKWMRSTYNAVRSNTIKVEKVLAPGQTFEEISNSLNASKPQDDWVNITIPQYITEEDYTQEDGSKIFSINLRNIGLNYIENIIDTLSGKNILGKDISTDFVFENDDLKTVMYDDAIYQALDMILKSMQGCIPEFPDYGIPNDYIGTNVNAFQYPVIFKAIMNMFQRDSRWKSVELLELERQKEAIFLKIKATAVTESNYIVNVPI